MSFLHASGINSHSRLRRPVMSVGTKKSVPVPSLPGAVDYLGLLQQTGYVCGQSFCHKFHGVRVGSSPFAGVSMQWRQEFKRYTSQGVRSVSDLKVQQALWAINHAVENEWYKENVIFVGRLLLPGEEDRLNLMVRIDPAGVRRLDLVKTLPNKDLERQVMVIC